MEPSMSPSESLGESSRSGAGNGPSPRTASSGNADGATHAHHSKRAAGRVPAKEDAERSSPPKKQKFSRSRTACLQCRSRKSKCGALPPDPCPNCIEADLPCQWPTEDGRSSKARLQRYRQQSVVHSLTPGGMPSGHDGLIDLKPQIGGQADVLGEGWLDRLLSGSDPGGSSAGAGAVAFTPGAYPNQQFAAPPLPVAGRFGFPPVPSTAGFPGGMVSQMPAVAGFNPLGNPSTVDPAQFVWAVSSRLPTVEDASPNDERSVTSDPSPVDPVARAQRRAAKAKSDEGKIVKVSWWRPHGQTAIAPGLKKITLKVRVNTPQDNWQSSSPQVLVSAGDAQQELIAPDGLPSTPIMRHLLDVFMTHFGCQFPFISSTRADLEAKIEARTGSAFLLLSIAAIAARFSTHPAIALPELQPYEYGNVFYAPAKSMLGSMLGVPSREAAAAFILLAHLGFSSDSESEVWMMTGLAVRMSIDAGLHMNPPESSAMTAEDRRLNRLVFWSVLLMDYALSFGVGRQTTFRPDDITQTLPTEEDLNPSSATTPSAADTPRSPFAFACKMMLSYGPLINMLNRGKGSDRDVYAARASAIREYNHLPTDMQWNVANLQRHSRNHQGSIFLHLHLWMHTIIASGFLTGADRLRRPISEKLAAPGLAHGGAVTPNTSTASTLWRNSVRTIGDILVLSDIINPMAYFALPFVNQAWFVAGCCFVKEIEQHAAGYSLPPSRAVSPLASPRQIINHPIKEVDHENGDAPASDDSSAGSGASQVGGQRGQVDLSRALLTSVATSNISTLQQGLTKLAKYWYGAEWIAGALGQRIEGIQDIDLVSVRENFSSFVSLPDAGVVRGGAGPAAEVSSPGGPGQTETFNGNDMDLGGLDFLSLPFDLGVEGGSNNITEQEVPLPQVFPSNWVR